MDEAKAGRIFGTFLADLVYFSAILGVGVISGKLLSKLLKAVISREIVKNAAKNKPVENHYPTENDYSDDLDFE